MIIFDLTYQFSLNLKWFKSKLNKTISLHHRVMTRNKIEEFKTALTDNDWSELNVATDVNAAYELVKNRFLKIDDEKLPITLKRIKPFKKIINPG